MKIQFVSDLHCEMHLDGGMRMLDELPVVGDVLVVAGDMAGHDIILDSLGSLCAKFHRVLYVPGNHEYYFSDREQVAKTLREAESRFRNLSILQNRVVEVDGQRFVGATGWFPDTPTNWSYESALNDFRLIRNYKKWVYLAHQEDRKFLLENVRPGDVVVTHHAPTNLSVTARFKASPLNRFYVSEFQDVIEKCRPRLWVHGHMHEPQDHEVMGCRVVANPRGYPRERMDFEPETYVEI